MELHPVPLSHNGGLLLSFPRLPLSVSVLSMRRHIPSASDFGLPEFDSEVTITGSKAAETNASSSLGRLEPGHFQASRPDTEALAKRQAAHGAPPPGTFTEQPSTTINPRRPHVKQILEQALGTRKRGREDSPIRAVAPPAPQNTSSAIPNRFIDEIMMKPFSPEETSILQGRAGSFFDVGSHTFNQVGLPPLIPKEHDTFRLSEDTVELFMTIMKMGSAAAGNNQRLFRRYLKWHDKHEEWVRGFTFLPRGCTMSLFVIGQITYRAWAVNSARTNCNGLLAAARDAGVDITPSDIACIQRAVTGLGRLAACLSVRPRQALDITLPQAIKIMLWAWKEVIRLACWAMPIIGPRWTDLGRAHELLLVQKEGAWFLVVAWGERKGESSVYSDTVEYPIPPELAPVSASAEQIATVDKKRTKNKDKQCHIDEFRIFIFAAFNPQKGTVQTPSVLEKFKAISLSSINEALKTIVSQHPDVITPDGDRSLSSYSYRRLYIQRCIAICKRDDGTVDKERLIQLTLHRDARTPLRVYDNLLKRVMDGTSEECMDNVDYALDSMEQFAAANEEFEATPVDDRPDTSISEDMVKILDFSDSTKEADDRPPEAIAEDFI